MNKMQDFTTTKPTEHTEKELELLTRQIIGAAIEVHRALGPGLLESTYEACLMRQLPVNKRWDSTIKDIKSFSVCSAVSVVVNPG